MRDITRMAQLRTATAFRDHLRQSGISLDFDDEVRSGKDSPLASPCIVNGRTIGNRFAILPMEGWDATVDGRPSDLTIRRWSRFGLSGAKLIFGGEAVAPRLDCRGNPNGLALTDRTQRDMAALLDTLVKTHEQRFGASDDLLVGLQLSDAGRFTRPRDKKTPEPRVVYHHPLLDRTVGLVPDAPVLTDDDISKTIDDFVHAAMLAHRIGFGFVDVKHCHGYLGHELLSAVSRPGRYGGSFENRTRFLRDVVAGIRAEAPGLEIGVRLSAFDFVPFRAGTQGIGEPIPFLGDSYPYAFGGDGTGVGIDLTEPLAFLDVLLDLGIRLVCITGGCGYYNYHIIRPCFMASKGSYLPPEDPLHGVARLVNVASDLKRLRPHLTYVASGLSYLQEWLPNVAQAIIRNGHADFAGLGRMAICYPEMAADVLAGRPLQRNRICRTCSRCTTAPRHGLVSGCYLTDPFYRDRPEFKQVEQLLRS